VPKKYHEFILPSVRRVYFDVSPQTDYKKRIQVLEGRVKTLERDRVLLMEKCESTTARNKIHAVGEKKAVQDAKKMKAMYETMKGKYETVKVKYEGVKEQ
jgi:hypothetical protein